MIHEYKVGEPVIVRWGGFNKNERIDKVLEITKAGNVRVGRVLYNKYGVQRGGDKCGACIRPASAEDVERLRHDKVILDCRLAMNALANGRAELSYELATKILEVIRKGGKNDT